MPRTVSHPSAAFVALAPPIAAQARPDAGAADPAFVIPSTVVHSLRSALNGVEYRLYVSLPPGYDTSTTRYPVVYLLDADYSFPVAHATAWHIAERGHLPPLVLVAIGYGGPPAYRLNRTRDYTPAVAQACTSDVAA